MRHLPKHGNQDHKGERMSANSPTIRIAKTNRLVKELGHDDVIAALRQAIEMQRALRVISTWASFPPLDCEDVRELAGKALGIEK